MESRPTGAGFTKLPVEATNVTTARRCGRDCHETPGPHPPYPAQLTLPAETGYARTSGSSNASLRCAAAVPASGYSPEKHASQCVPRSPAIAS
jgi:hypothetical protein